MTTEKQRKITINGPDMAEPLEIPMRSAGTATIGRGSENSLRVKHPLVSRRHLEIRGTPAHCQVVDLASTYGTMINGARIEPNEPVTLTDGDLIEIGPYTIAFQEEVVEVSLPVPLPDPPQNGQRNGALEPTSIQPAKEPEFRPRTTPRPPVFTTAPINGSANGEYTLPPGLSYGSSRYLEYLPEIYHTQFMGRFLALFESILAPIEWQIENFDLYLSPKTAPAAFLPWLANWFDVVFDETWSETQRRTLLNEAHEIFARRGTKDSLTRILEIYTGDKPEIDDLGEDLDPFMFAVRIPKREEEVNRELIERLIDVNKPAHTSYHLSFIG